MDWLKDLPKMPLLSKGSHKPGSAELCAMELVAFMERLPHSASPECTCEVITPFTQNGNDAMSPLERQKLLPLLPLLVGTVDQSALAARAEIAVKWAFIWAEAARTAADVGSNQTAYASYAAVHAAGAAYAADVAKTDAAYANAGAAAGVAAYYAAAAVAAAYGSKATYGAAYGYVEKIWSQFREALIEMVNVTSAPEKGSPSWSRERTLEALAMQE